jgi:hypothetical protein
MSWLQPIFIDPEEAGALFLAQVAAFALTQIWQAGREASREELGGHPRPPRDILHLLLTGFAIVLGLVLLILWISHPIGLPHIERQGNVLPLMAFLIFVYVILVIGITSGHRTSGEKLNPWSAALVLLMAALLLFATIMTPMLIPNTYVPKQYQGLISLLIAVAGVMVWHFLARRLKDGARSIS